METWKIVAVQINDISRHSKLYEFQEFHKL